MAAHTVAVDCGGTRLRVSRASGATLGPVHASPAPDRLEGLPDAIRALDDLDGAAAIGVAVAGLVDAERGRLLWMPHRLGGPVDLAAFGAEHGIPVVVDNDANMAALAEAIAGSGSGYRMVLAITVGTGIGGGLVIDGRVERGRGFLGEVGHLPAPGGSARCGCGLVGCWESVASGRALDQAARDLVSADPRGPLAAAMAGRQPFGVDLARLASEGDLDAIRAVETVGAALGRGLGGMVAVFDPDVIVIGGGVGALGELILAPARVAMWAATPGREHRRETPVVGARFGTDAGLVGAALAAAEAT